MTEGSCGLAISRVGGRYDSGIGMAGLDAAVRGRQLHVVDGEGPFPADVAGECEPPAQQRADAVAVAGEEGDVDEQPDPPAQEAAEVQLERGNDGLAAGDIRG